MVFQMFNVFPHLSAAENVMLGLRKVCKLADAVIFMDGGPVQVAGPPRQVLVNPQHERLKAFLARLSPEHGLESFP